MRECTSGQTKEKEGLNEGRESGQALEPGDTQGSEVTATNHGPPRQLLGLRFGATGQGAGATARPRLLHCPHPRGWGHRASGH